MVFAQERCREPGKCCSLWLQSNFEGTETQSEVPFRSHHLPPGIFHKSSGEERKGLRGAREAWNEALSDTGTHKSVHTHTPMHTHKSACLDTQGHTQSHTQIKAHINTLTYIIRQISCKHEDNMEGTHTKATAHRHTQTRTCRQVHGKSPSLLTAMGTWIMLVLPRTGQCPSLQPRVLWQLLVR